MTFFSLVESFVVIDRNKEMSVVMQSRRSLS